MSKILLPTADMIKNSNIYRVSKNYGPWTAPTNKEVLFGVDQYDGDAVYQTYIYMNPSFYELAPSNAIFDFGWSTFDFHLHFNNTGGFNGVNTYIGVSAYKTEPDPAWNGSTATAGVACGTMLFTYPEKGYNLFGFDYTKLLTDNYHYLVLYYYPDNPKWTPRQGRGLARAVCDPQTIEPYGEKYVDAPYLSAQYSEGLMRYGVGSMWNPCFAYIGIDGRWQQCFSPCYGINDEWKPLDK